MGEAFSTVKVLLTLIIAVKVSLEGPASFNRQHTGIEFWPYIRAEHQEHIPTLSSFTVQNVRTMLEVVSTKFSRIIINSVDVDIYDTVRYRRNATYYHYAFVRARTAEIAALINRERSNLSLTVLIGIFDRDWRNSLTASKEFEVAIEASQIAQSIYPGTVEGLFLTNHDDSSIKWASETLRWLKTLRNLSTTIGLQIGTRQFCGAGLSLEQPIDADAKATEIMKLRKEIVLNSDFLMCSSIPSQDYAKHGAIYSFNAVHNAILRTRFEIQAVKNNVDVMWHTYWKPVDFNETLNNMKNVQEYWKKVDQFASDNNLTVWLQGAFDNPNQLEYIAWWKLINIDHINNVSGYVEKVSSLSKEQNIGNNSATKRASETSNGTSKDEDEGFSKYANIFGGILLVLALAGIAYLIYRKIVSSRSGILTKQDVDEFRQGCLDTETYGKYHEESFVNSTALKLPYDNSLEIPKSKLEILSDQILGGGEFGCVFKAIVKDYNDVENEVALKMTRPNGGTTAMKGLLSEIKILSYLGQHVNIVPIYGAYTAEINKGTIYLATELCPLGSLKNLLKNFRNSTKRVEGKGESTPPTLPITDMIRWSYEIACGMEYLGQKNVVHADLATRNVLLSSDRTAKITDFGLSRRLYEYTTYTKSQQEPLPWRWMSIESLKLSEFSTMSDVWSYGVTLWEIFSLGTQPYPGLTWSAEFIETLEEGFRLSEPKHATAEIFGIMSRCWNLVPDGRPTFAELKQLARDSLTNTMDDDDYTKLTECHSDEVINDVDVAET